MKSKFEEVAIVDSSRLANEIMRDIVDVDKMERMLETDLTSEELFRIDCAILASLRSTKDFSRDLLYQLETGTFEDFSTKPQQSSKNIQQGVVMDITFPLQEMLCQMACFVEEALKEQ